MKAIQHNLLQVIMGLGVKSIPSQQQQKMTETSGKQEQDIGITKKYYSVISSVLGCFCECHHHIHPEIPLVIHCTLLQTSTYYHLELHRTAGSHANQWEHLELVAIGIHNAHYRRPDHEQGFSTYIWEIQHWQTFHCVL